jgi:maltose O-acetyltransferase
MLAGGRATGMASERDKMRGGDWYCCLDPELDALRAQARAAVHAHNTLSPESRGAVAPALAALLAEVGDGAFVEAPFHCAYGINIRLGAGAYVNAGCVVLDSAPVTIGARAMLGPAVQIYCAEHHKEPQLRRQGLEIARPVGIGADAWIGGGAILLAGVTVGAGAIVGAGAVVTRDVPAGATVVGNPARVVG